MNALVFDVIERGIETNLVLGHEIGDEYGTASANAQIAVDEESGLHGLLDTVVRSRFA